MSIHFQHPSMVFDCPQDVHENIPKTNHCYQSGSFDFPPASADTNTLEYARSTTIDPRVTSRRNMGSRSAILHQYERERQQEHRRRIIQAEILASRAGTRRQVHEDQVSSNPHFPTSAVRPRVSASRIRRRVTAGFASPHRSPIHFGPAGFGLDFPEPILPRIGSPDMALAEYSGEAEVNRRRKRPKLDHRYSTRGSKGFHYEWEGRARQGRLAMDIQECDGGIHAEVATQDCHRYKLENLLKNDQSVYCTERNKCNIILKHSGDVCFNMTKIVIKAPERGFTAPQVYLLYGCRQN